MKVRVMLSTLLMLGVLSAPAQAIMIGAPGGGPDIFPWGKPNTQTYGQTITVGAQNVLSDFSFWLGRGFTPAYNLNYQAHVYAWNQATMRATGPALYSSAVLNIAGNNASPNTQQTFNTGLLTLTPGSRYVLFLSTSGLAGAGRSYWEGSGRADQYLGGDFVFQNNGENTALWTLGQWSTFGNGNPATEDLRFSANLRHVPEPGSLALLGIGLLGAAAWRRRR